MRLKLLALVAAMVPLSAGAGAAVQSNPGLRFSPSDQSESFGRPDLSFRINEVIAPDTIVGIGLFDTMPKARGTGADPRLDARSKRSRKAAMGLSLKF